jgi:hypothetical protein
VSNLRGRPHVPSSITAGGIAYEPGERGDENAWHAGGGWGALALLTIVAWERHHGQRQPLAYAAAGAAADRNDGA